MPKPSEYFPDMGQVLFGVVRIHQDVVQIHDYRESETSIISAKISFMNLWNLAGAFVSPSGITSHSKDPYQVWNVVFHSSPSAIRMR